MGRPHTMSNGVKLYSPTVDSVLDIGEVDYSINLVLSTFDKEKVLLHLFNVSQNDYDRIADTDDYEVLSDHPSIIPHICRALSFFAKEEVLFDVATRSFITSESVLVNSDNYKIVQSIIRELNGIQTNVTPKKMTGKAKAFHERMNFFKSKLKKSDDDIELKDMLSILCSANGNGIDIFNVGGLTIYQVYEHFERVTVKENYDRILPVWANGNLKENAKFPEWIKRTRL